MANFDRGVYEPSDDVRVFDGAEDDEDVEGSRLPLLIVLALLVLAMFGGVVWLAYTQGVARGRGETPVLTAANGPDKVAPNQTGNAAAPYQGFKIYEQPAPADDSGDAAPAANTAPPLPKTVPPPEAAMTKPAEASKPAPTVAKPAATVTPPAPKAVQQAVVAPAPKPVATTTQPAPKPAAKREPATKTMDALIRQAETAPAATQAPATSAPRALTPVAAAPSGGGSAVLQIGAYKSQADADTAWKTYKAKHALAGNYSEDVARVDLGEKGTWYRLRMSGFADKSAAATACTKLRADGGDCMLAK